MEIVKDEDMNVGKRHGHRRYNDNEKCYKSLRTIYKWKYEYIETKENKI